MDSVKYFSVEVCFTTILSQSIGCQCYFKHSKENKRNGNCTDFIGLHWKKNRFARSCLILIKLLTLYLAIIYSTQLSNSIHWLTIKSSLVDFRDFTYFFTRTFFPFPLSRHLSVHLSVTQNVWCGLMAQPCCWFWETQISVFDLIDEIFENLNSIMNIFQETQ